MSSREYEKVIPIDRPRSQCANALIFFGSSTGISSAEKKIVFGSTRLISPVHHIWKIDSLVHLQDRKKRLLWYLNTTHLFHSPLAFFLLLEQLTFAGDIPSVALGDDILA